MPPGNMTLTYKTVQMSSPHFVMYWKELSWTRNPVVPPGNTTLAYKTVQMSTSHFVMYWKEVSWSPLAWTGAFSRK